MYSTAECTAAAAGPATSVRAVAGSSERLCSALAVGSWSCARADCYIFSIYTLYATLSLSLYNSCSSCILIYLLAAVVSRYYVPTLLLHCGSFGIIYYTPLYIRRYISIYALRARARRYCCTSSTSMSPPPPPRYGKNGAA